MKFPGNYDIASLQWRHNDRNGVSNHQLHDCLLNRLFRHRWKKTSKAPRHWPLWGEFTGDRWIPCTKGQQRGKSFHLMTSSWLHNARFEPKSLRSNDSQITKPLGLISIGPGSDVSSSDQCLLASEQTAMSQNLCYLGCQQVLDLHTNIMGVDT